MKDDKDIENLIKETLDFCKQFGYEELKTGTSYHGLNIGTFRNAQRTKFKKANSEEKEAMIKIFECISPDFLISEADLLKKRMIEATNDFCEKFGEESLVKTTVHNGFNIGAYKYAKMKENDGSDLAEEKASSLIKELLETHEIDYQYLSELLRNIGVSESNTNLSNKIQRGKFSFSFVLQILDVIKKELVLSPSNENKEVISKEQFIESFMETIELLKKTDTDEIYKTLERTQDLLYKRIGLTNEVIEHINNGVWEKLHHSTNPTKQDIGDFYDEIKKENEVSILANNLYSKIAKL